MKTKKCTKCGVEQDVTEFHKRKAAKDGLKPWCKTCNTKYCADNKEKLYRQGVLYRKNNAEKLATEKQDWVNKNQEEYKKYQSKYKEENVDRILAYNKQYHTDNKEKIKIKKKIYKESNLEKVTVRKTAALARYRAKKLNQTPENQTDLEKALILALYTAARILGNTCGEAFHIDHIKPISKGGLHSFDNLQILTAADNLSKGNKY